MNENDRHGLGTRAIHAVRSPGPGAGAAMTPIHAASACAQQSPGVHQGYEHRRSHNPIGFARERRITVLEGVADLHEELAACPG